MLTEKENLLRMYRGEMPEFLPRMGFRDIKCSYFVDVKTPGYVKDEFGVEYMGKEDIFSGTPIPMPGKYILHDITKWRDVIKNPDLSHVDWEAYARKDTKDFDRENYGMVIHYGKIFQRLIDFMGFTEGLCALVEEPEEAYALFEYICDYQCEIIKNMIYYYKPDAVCIPDDTATARAPFISLETYRKLIKPFHKRVADLALNSGILIQKHDCGKSEAFVDDWVEMGITHWDPAQPSNDLVGIKKKYGRKLVIAGGWDSQGPVSYPDVDEQVLKDELVKYVDTLAPGGGFIFSAYVGGDFKDPKVKRKYEIINNFYNDYARDWYKTHS